MRADLPGLSEAAQQCLQEQFNKVVALAQQVSDSLAACAGEQEEEVSVNFFLIYRFTNLEAYIYKINNKL